LNIRLATLDDASACRAIYAPFVTEGWISFEEQVPSAEEMQRRIAESMESHGWFIAEDGDIVGYAYGSPHASRSAYRKSCDVAVYVQQGQQKRGIGRALYDTLLPHLKQRGYHAAFAGVALPNEGSIGLHKAFGFESVGIYREVGWKMGSWRDVEWLQRLL